MEVIYLEPNQTPDKNSDFVIVERLPSGLFQFSGSIQTGENQANFVHHGKYSTIAEAQDAGIQWAQERGAEKLIVAVPV